MLNYKLFDDMQKMLILGSQGMLGTEMFYFFQSKYEVIPLASFNLDITDKERVFKMINQISPDLVINCAAYTNVERAEARHEKEVALKINGESVDFLAEICSQKGIQFVQISTDYVFDGTKKTGYLENDLPHPQNVYGSSKHLGETNILKWAKIKPDWKFFIVRTAWLYGQYGPNFVKKMLHLARTKGEVKIVEDQIGSPTWTLALVKGIEVLIQNENYQKGIYHLSGEGEGSWADFAEEIFKLKNLSVPVLRVGSVEFPQVAKRPSYSVLKNTKGPKMEKWQKMLQDYLK